MNSELQIKNNEKISYLNLFSNFFFFSGWSTFFKVFSTKRVWSSQRWSPRINRTIRQPLDLILRSCRHRGSDSFGISDPFRATIRKWFSLFTSMHLSRCSGYFKIFFCHTSNNTSTNLLIYAEKKRSKYVM